MLPFICVVTIVFVRVNICERFDELPRCGIDTSAHIARIADAQPTAKDLSPVIAHPDEMLETMVF